MNKQFQKGDHKILISQTSLPQIFNMISTLPGNLKDDLWELKVAHYNLISGEIVYNCLGQIQSRSYNASLNNSKK